MKLSPDEKIDIVEILKDLDRYQPKRKGWTWRRHIENHKIGPFVFKNGAHQDPQYNVLYRNINMHRSFVDAAEAKTIMTNAKILQIDGAHNANATAKEAWKVMPELLVQHAINSAFSNAVGMPKDRIALSTVPPTAPPAPKRCSYPPSSPIMTFIGKTCSGSTTWPLSGESGKR
jgi:hypothetical protein